MAELKEKEERLRFLLSKIDSEIGKFKEMSESLEEKKNALVKEISRKGVAEVPVEITPHSGEQESLAEEITCHLLELNKMKNYLGGKLEIILKEEELLEELKKKYGSKVSLVKGRKGEFEIMYTDAETDAVYTKLKAGKKLVLDMRESMKGLIKEE